MPLSFAPLIHLDHSQLSTRSVCVSTGCSSHTCILTLLHLRASWATCNSALICNTGVGGFFFFSFLFPDQIYPATHVCATRHTRQTHACAHTVNETFLIVMLLHPETGCCPEGIMMLSHHSPHIVMWAHMSRKSVESSKKTYILSKKKKKTQKGQMFRSPSTVAGERSALESPLMEDECDRPGKSEERGRESEHSREWRTLCEPRHFCRFRFQAEGLSGWCKKKKRKKRCR